MYIQAKHDFTGRWPNDGVGQIKSHLGQCRVFSYNRAKAIKYFSGLHGRHLPFLRLENLLPSEIQRALTRTISAMENEQLSFYHKPDM